ncbi:MAG: hypothetical protein CSA33_02270 [Desulfobulbus propionicus]|nr:MAG: hypothetical protein CSA33_02270 [Desulfobulbus propionicus]
MHISLIFYCFFFFPPIALFLQLLDSSNLNISEKERRNLIKSFIIVLLYYCNQPKTRVADRLHTLTAINPSTGDGFPLVSLLTPS